MYGRVILGKLATNEKSKKSLVIKASSMRSAYVNHFIHFPDFVIALIAGGLHLEKKKTFTGCCKPAGLPDGIFCICSKNSNLVIFWRALESKMMVHFTDICKIV
jgi:hypothetical protein